VRVTWRLADVLRATGAEVYRRGDATSFTGIATDSRALARGALFVALRGERFDAHHFAAEAAGAGAAGVLVERVPAELERFQDLTILTVPDGLRALQDLASDLRHRVAPCVLAITGSNGKTTTKEMLAAILAASGGAAGVLKTRVNLNNLIGVPLTLLRLTGEERHAVVEMGMNAPGEIWRLTEIADPDVGVITNVAPAHLEGVGSIAGVARAKGELFACMRPDATAIVNADDPHVVALGAAFSGRVVRFSALDGGDVRAEDVRTDAHGAAAFRLHIGAASIDVHLRIAGRHNVANALAAAAAAHAVGVGIEAIAAGLGAALPVGSRMRVCALPTGVTILDDSYNANPASVAAALRSLREAPAARRIAVLGDMLELGPAAADLHREIGRLASSLGIDALYLFGEYAAATAAGVRDGGGLPPEAVHCLPTHAAIAEAIATTVRPGDWVLVKGSRGQRMEEVVRLLGAAE
jgi:UDP-N-acetylmuramoyl-tripeptide--D-alanyl-D-alanine ligase